MAVIFNEKRQTNGPNSPPSDENQKKQKINLRKQMIKKFFKKFFLGKWLK